MLEQSGWWQEKRWEEGMVKCVLVVKDVGAGALTYTVIS
jgi:hypothetical protein